jgi:DNA-binding MarR family transcriptional regulator
MKPSDKRTAPPVPPLASAVSEHSTLELTTLRLSKLADLMNRAASLAYPRSSGLSDSECRIIAWVCEMPPFSINDLAARLHRDVAQVSRTVKKLVAAGLLHRASRRGGPGVLISPTQLGYAVFTPLAMLARQRNATVIAGLTSDEIKHLDRCIAIMTKNALKQLANEKRRQSREKAGQRARRVE